MKQKINLQSYLTRLRGLMLTLIILLTIGSGNVWGATATATSSTSTLVASTSYYDLETGKLIEVKNSAANNYSNPLRIYANNTFTFHCKSGATKITKIEVTANSSSYASTTQSATWTASGTGSCSASSSVSGSIVTVTITGTATTVTCKPTAQIRWDSVEVTYETAGASYTVTASSNNNSYGTVSVSGTTITATPADCYQVVSGTGGYTVTSGTATVSHTGTSNTLTVTPSTNCTVQVNFEKQTVNTYVDEIQGYEDMEECGTHDAPSLDDKAVASSGTCAEQHWHFMGWVTAANKANPTDANIITPGTEMTANGTTYYAVWAKGTGGGGFDGEHGGTFKIYAIDDKGTKNYMTNTVSSNKISSTTTEASAQEYTLTAVTGGFTISYEESSTTYYVYHRGTNTANISIGTNAATWNIVAGTNGSWRVKSPYSTRSLIYRTTNVFAAYANSNATATSTEYYDLEIGGGYEYSDYITTCGSTYTITLAGSPAGTVTGGTFSASASSASQGTVITLTATPSRGYEFSSWTVTDASSNPVTVTSNQFTMPASNVTVSATFNTATPLTITLSTKSKGTFTNPDPWPIYSGETFIFPSVTPNDPTCATFVGWIAGTTFDGDGSTHDAPTGLITAGTESTAQTTDATYTAVFYETETTESDAYVKVTSAPANWANDHYLIVYESGGLAFDGSRTDAVDDKIDASYNTVDVTITSGAIAATSALAASEWKIALISGSNYSIQSASGKYIGNASNSNALTTSAEALANTLSISSGDFGVESSGGAYLRYNATSGQERFRYYKSSSYSSQQAIQLFKLGTAVVETQTYTTNPACTPKYRVTVASVTGGSPNADPKFNPEGDEVTLTANPAAGYSFTSWTITKTTGGDDVTTTLLGANATTANTSFSMPAYDVTVTASYAKIPVASLQVKDGETVIANSGTVNISTGANKTLTVVVTPADAFDHSWSASVTGGGTYASITNVQAGTFQVNGLAQGDATVTVTAPNDGDAKTVTFTVHVTDILPTEVVLKRDGSNTSISELSIYEGQYVKVNVSFTPTPTNKDFSVSADGTFVTIHAQAHTNPNYYATLNGKKVTTSPVNVTFTSAATSSVTKNLVVTVLPLLTDTFVDYIHGQATQTVSARLSVDKFTLYTDINTPSLSDASDADPISADCETSHYHLIGWLPKATAEALWAAGTAITESTEGLVKVGVQVEATGQTWYAIWGKEQ